MQHKIYLKSVSIDSFECKVFRGVWVYFLCLFSSEYRQGIRLLFVPMCAVCIYKSTDLLMYAAR